MKNNKKVWIIGDIHGCYHTLKALYEQIPPGSEIWSVGDLIDRGMYSLEVIEFIQEKGIKALCGNHEYMMLADRGEIYDTFYGMYSSLRYTDWGGNGGVQAFESFVKKHKAPFSDILEYIKTLPYYKVFDDIVDEQGRKLLITHAQSLNYIEKYFEYKERIKTIERTSDNDFKYIELKSFIDNAKNNMVWNRNIPKKISKKYFNIFGHTYISVLSSKMGDEEFDASFIQKYSILINREKGYGAIDTNPFLTTIEVERRETEQSQYEIKRGKYLTAIAFPTMEVIQQKNIEPENIY